MDSVRRNDRPVFLGLDEGLVDVSGFDAIAVTPKHNVNFQGLHTLDMNNFSSIVGTSRVPPLCCDRLGEDCGKSGNDSLRGVASALSPAIEDFRLCILHN
jgi:hypothetical protein